MVNITRMCCNCAKVGRPDFCHDSETSHRMFVKSIFIQWVTVFLAIPRMVERGSNLEQLAAWEIQID
jgi:hypothetical protein